MGFSKWISGAIGWAVAGPIGGILGFAMASILENGKFISGNGNGNEQRNSFLVSLLVLSSAVMKADGKILKSELDYVKAFLITNFGTEAASEALLYLKELLEKEIDITSVGSQIGLNMQYEARIQLLHYLTGIAKADGRVSDSELGILKQIAIAMGVSQRESEAVFAMFKVDDDSLYKVLEIDRNATDQEIKRAYKRLAVKHHPDKVSNLGPDVQRAAEERFKSISLAYEKIKKERGIV
ncbi:MAG: molecular chaperone DnaJ [Bacteroidetes bacterium HGW-Bacteroidetes-7]|jgi:DnaJ like chaperone protein|nr:MAG: molecular chaperone DnaJ [Bacteroidetes bacterium HGW-Bacteroidetes-7]